MHTIIDTFKNEINNLHINNNINDFDDNDDDIKNMLQILKDKKLNKKLKLNGKCSHNNCKSKIFENNYCKKHQIVFYENNLHNENLRMCCNFNKGCRNSVLNYVPSKKCQSCVEKKITDKKNKIRKKRPDNITDLTEIINFCDEHNINNEQNDVIMFCNKCLNGYPKKFFIFKDEEFILCKICRMSNYKKR